MYIVPPVLDKLLAKWFDLNQWWVLQLYFMPYAILNDLSSINRPK
jgi:hypothetical protein